MSAVFDFKSISQKLNRMEQKADLDAKNPKTEPKAPVWHPEYGYGMAPAIPFNTPPDLVEKLKELAVESVPKFSEGSFWRDMNFKI